MHRASPRNVSAIQLPSEGSHLCPAILNVPLAQEPLGPSPNVASKGSSLART